MSGIAVFLMLLTIILVWGGLVASVVLLQVLPVPGEDDEASPSISIDEDGAAQS